MLMLGFASGLPLALSSGTLQAWLTVEGLDITTIGFFALAGLPYTFKFVWAPLADRFEPPMLAGRRRSWLLVTQIGLAVACFAMATLDPKVSVYAVGACAVAIAFLSASQDIVFDAYRTDLLDETERGAGAAVSVLGYRVAMLVSGGLALIIADQWLGWPNMFRLMGVLFGGMALVTLWSPKPPPAETLRSEVRSELVGFVAMLAAGAATFWLLRQLPWQWLLGNDRFGGLAADTVVLVIACLAALRAARAAGFPSFLAPWDAFFSRERAAWLLALIVLYKLGDAFAGSLSTSFLIRGAGFTPTEVGAVNKVLGLLATIVGALAGGAWLARRPLYASLMLFGILQAVSNFGYWLISVLPKNYTLMAAAIGFENLCGGMGTAAFVAFLMSLTDRRFSAAQYALLSALAAVGRVYVGPVSGLMVAAFGWPSFFVFSVAAALPGLALLAWLKPQVIALDSSRGGAAIPDPPPVSR
jgi:PAT family beta-lactamase induction signal transducer AmpG